MWRAAGLALFLFSSVAMAEPVVLVSNDGYSKFRGDLIKVENSFYVVRTSIGVVRIPMSDVRCEGTGCPTLATGKADAIEPAGQALTGNQGQALTEDQGQELTEDQKDELFKSFLEWGKKKTN